MVNRLYGVAAVVLVSTSAPVLADRTADCERWAQLEQIDRADRADYLSDCIEDDDGFEPPGFTTDSPEQWDQYGSSSQADGLDGGAEGARQAQPGGSFDELN